MDSWCGETTNFQVTANNNIIISPRQTGRSGIAEKPRDASYILEMFLRENKKLARCQITNVHIVFLHFALNSIFCCLCDLKMKTERILTILDLNGH